MPGEPPAERIGDRFELIEQIGAGGMSTVWLARDPRLGRNVALKRLHPHLAESPGSAERFGREAMAAAALSHPAIVTVYDVGEDDQGPYLVMEYVDGRTLSEELALRGPLGFDEVVSIGLACAEALAHAHSRGVIHRDVKPGNILVGADGSVRVTDFGIAKVAWETEDLTETAVLLGTAAYLSPEQAAGGEATAASDLYSLGVVLYEMTAGRVPFPADNPVAAALAHTSLMPDPPNQLRQVPLDLEDLVMRCLAKDPADRFPDAPALANALGVLQAPSVGQDDQPEQGLAVREGPTTLVLSIPEGPTTLALSLPSTEESSTGGDSPTEVLPGMKRAAADPTGRWSRRARAGAAVAAVMLGGFLLWALANRAAGEAELPAAATSVPEPIVPSTAAATVPLTTALANPRTFDEALIILIEEVEGLETGRQIFPPLKRDLEQLLAEIAREWEKDHSADKTTERLHKFLEVLSEGRDDGQVASEAADRLIEAGLQALSFLPDDD